MKPPRTIAQKITRARESLARARVQVNGLEGYIQALEEIQQEEDNVHQFAVREWEKK
jgi:hypothetical protein